DAVRAGGGVPVPAPDGYAGVIVAASVHVSGYQRAVERWIAAHRNPLQAKPSAFLSVCLGVLQEEPSVQREIAAIMDGFLTRVSWKPPMTRTIAGALLYTRYDWIKRWVMRRISRKAGRETDPSRDYEYTDWNAVRAFAVEFLKLVVRGGST
ncbi:MAG: flavodoxin domain-containing protein, partial [Candidatus Eiseniibacteriota bacterium]